MTEPYSDAKKLAMFLQEKTALSRVSLGELVTALQIAVDHERITITPAAVASNG